MSNRFDFNAFDDFVVDVENKIKREKHQKIRKKSKKEKKNSQKKRNVDEKSKKLKFEMINHSNHVKIATNYTEYRNVFILNSKNLKFHQRSRIKKIKRIKLSNVYLKIFRTSWFREF